MLRPQVKMKMYSQIDINHILGNLILHLKPPLTLASRPQRTILDEDSSNND